MKTLQKKSAKEKRVNQQKKSKQIAINASLRDKAFLNKAAVNKGMTLEEYCSFLLKGGISPLLSA